MTASPSSTIPSAHPGLPEPNELARRLGHAGLTPFVAGAVFVWLLVGRMDEEAFAFVMRALSTYAALIVSFLGGIPWALTMLGQQYHEPPTALQNRALKWAVAYSLAAWVAALMPPHAGLAALGGLLVGCYLVDRKLYPPLGAAGWLKLRFRLTIASSLCCFLAAAQL